MLMGRLTRYQIGKLQWFSKGSNWVPLLTFRQLWSCQITIIFQQSCIKPTELLWCNFSLKTDCLQECCATILFLAPTLAVECSYRRRKAGLHPVPTCSSQGDQQPVGTLWKALLWAFVWEMLCLGAIYPAGVASVPLCRSLHAPHHLRSLKSHASEAAFILSRESVADPC